MTTYYDHGRRGAYGWMYVLGVVVSIFSGLAARQFQIRKERLLNKAQAANASNPLVAVAIVNLSGVTHRFYSKFYSVGGGYELCLKETVNEVESKSVYTFSTIQQLEQFLDSKTVLRLRDFKPR